jgi:serine/threonine protein kinase/sugar lactone lactonase YvrE
MTGRIGPYDVVREIGRGGMAVVYLARQPALGRSVALKELAPFHVRDESLARRFIREARVAGSLNHPNVVTVYDFIEHDGTPYIAMEYLDRGSLRRSVGRMSPAQVAGVLEGLLAGLSHAESIKIVHRDVKPENLLVTDDGGIKIADFGIAKAYYQVATEEMLTPAGATVGTPTYMAPEQAMAQEIGPWTDLYQAGVVAYELLAGRVPFRGEETPVAQMMQHINDPVPPLPSGTDPALERWVRTMLAKNPAERPGGAREAWDELEEIVVATLGPLWRRDARLGEPDPTVEHQVPLTPAPFSTWEDYVAPQPARPPSSEPPTPPPPWAEPAVDAPPEPSAAEPPRPEPPAQPLRTAPPRAEPPRAEAPRAEPPRASPPPEPPPTVPPPPVAPAPAEPPGRADSPARRRRRAPPILPLGALALLAAVVAALLLTRGGDPPAEPRETATATATATATPATGPFVTGDGPDGVAVGAGAVWVAASREDAVTRIDPETGETASVKVGGNPDSVVVAFGEVWVSLSDDDRVVRLSTGPRPERVGSVNVGSRPEGLAASQRAVWVANAGDGTVTQIVASSRETRTVRGVGVEPVDLAIGAGAVWVADSASASVARVDGGRRVLARTITGIGPNPRALAIRGREVWVVTADDGRAWRIDGDADEVTGSVRVGGQPRDIAVRGDRLWVTDRERDRVVEIDPDAMKVVARRRVSGGPLGLAVDDEAVWVSRFDRGEVSRLALGGGSLAG